MKSILGQDIQIFKKNVVFFQKNGKKSIFFCKNPHNFSQNQFLGIFSARFSSNIIRNIITKFDDCSMKVMGFYKL